MELIKPNASPEYVVQTLRWSVSMGQTDVLQALLRTHFTTSKLSDMSELCYDLLIEIVSKGSCDLLQHILPYVDETFLSNEHYKMGKTHISKMLCKAVANGNTATAKLLIKKGADVNISYEGKPLLHLAIQYGHTDTAKALVDHCAETKDALVPLIQSSLDSKLKVEFLDLLLKHGVDPTLAGTNGKQPIHVAAAQSAVIVEKLVNSGSDVNAQDPIHGDTPMHIACGMCCRETVESLIKCGAKFNLLNNHGETPLQKLLKFVTNFQDFHAQTRLKLAKFLVNIGFTIAHAEKKKDCRKARGRDKVRETYNDIVRSSKNVFTLQHICRLGVRNGLQTSTPIKATKSLDIPKHLIHYLNFGDGFLYNTSVQGVLDVK